MYTPREWNTSDDITRFAPLRRRALDPAWLLEIGPPGVGRSLCPAADAVAIPNEGRAAEDSLNGPLQVFDLRSPGSCRALRPETRK